MWNVVPPKVIRNIFFAAAGRNYQYFNAYQQHLYPGCVVARVWYCVWCKTKTMSDVLMAPYYKSAGSYLLFKCNQYLERNR